jgi:hypothetical protein
MTLPNSLCILQLALAWLLTTDLAWLVAAVALELLAFLFLGFAVGFIISLSCVCCMFVLRAVNALVGPAFFFWPHGSQCSFFPGRASGMAGALNSHIKRQD